MNLNSLLDQAKIAASTASEEILKVYHSDDFEKLNKPEVDRILKEIPDLQDKDQKWKDAFIQGLNSTFYGDQ